MRLGTVNMASLNPASVAQGARLARLLFEARCAKCNMFLLSKPATHCELNFGALEQVTPITYGKVGILMDWAVAEPWAESGF